MTIFCTLIGGSFDQGKFIKRKTYRPCSFPDSGEFMYCCVNSHSTSGRNQTSKVPMFVAGFGHLEPTRKRWGRPFRGVSVQISTGSCDTWRRSLARMRLLGLPTAAHIAGPTATSTAPRIRVSINKTSTRGSASPTTSVSCMKLNGTAGIKRCTFAGERKFAAGITSAEAIKEASGSEPCSRPALKYVDTDDIFTLEIQI